MSWITGLQTEALSSNNAVGTALASSTTATIISPASGAAYVPAGFWPLSYGQGKAVLVKAFGVLSTTGTPTFTIGVYADTTQGTLNGSGAVAVSAATTMGSGVSNVPWSLDVIISCVGTGASGTFLSDGVFQVGTTSVIQARVSSSTANPNTAFTLSTESAYYLEVGGTWGTSSASNTVTCYQMVVLGLN